MAPSKKISASTFIIRFICGFLLGILAGLFASINLTDSVLAFVIIVLACAIAHGLLAAIFGDRFWYYIAHSGGWL